MTGFCPAPAPDAPLVKGLLTLVDCHVRTLTHSGYSAIFEPSSAFSFLLTALLTIYIAVVGYRLMLGQGELRVTDFALGAVKIGAVIALTTQWDTYQAVVYQLLFDGPRQLAGAMLVGVQANTATFGGDVFDGLQRAFDDLSGFANGYRTHAPAQISPLAGGAGFGALLLTGSASVLLMSSLGVLLAAKIVLGLLLGVGPLFIALMLFESTRGLFEGWLRASLAFAFAPFATTLLLGLALAMLEPSLLQMEAAGQANTYQLAPVYSVATLVMVFAGVSFAALLAGGMIAAGFRMPKTAKPANLSPPARSPPQREALVLVQSRANGVAAAASRLERRDIQMLHTTDQTHSDRRTAFTQSGLRSEGQAPAEVRLGQTPSRRLRPRAVRPTQRSA